MNIAFLMKDIASGKSTLFAPRLPADYAVWMGEIKPLSYFQVPMHFPNLYFVADPVHQEFKAMQGFNLPFIGLFQEKYNVTQVFYTDEIKEVLLDQYQATGTPLLFLLHGLNTDSNKYTKPAEFQVYVSSRQHQYTSCTGLILIAQVL